MKKVLSLVKEIKKQMISADEMTEIKNQIVDAINATNAGSEKKCDQGILQKK